MRTIKENIEGENPVHSIRSTSFTSADRNPRHTSQINPQIKQSMPRQTTVCKNSRFLLLELLELFGFSNCPCANAPEDFQIFDGIIFVARK